MAKRYKCPYCELRDERKKLIAHIDKRHEEMLPEGYDGARTVYDMINHTNGHGTCRICKKDTQWNMSSQRYDVLCGNPKCKEAMREEYKKNMIRVKGTYNILNDPEQQQKMLANRKISGKYRYSDGTMFTYTGSYEKKLLEFEDAVMNIPSKDIMMPGPTIEYMYNGKKHFYIADQLYIPYNLIIEIKDGGDNKNGKETPGMIASREKTIEKEKVITDKGEYNYLRLTNNDFVQLIEIFMELKDHYLIGDDSKIVKINESCINESEEYNYNQKTTDIIKDEIGDDVSIISGDIFDSEITHHIENFEKSQYEAMLESENIVRDYNNFIQLKIENLIKTKRTNNNVAIFDTFLVFYNTSIEEYNKQKNDPEVVKELENLGIKSENDLKKYIIGEFTHKPSENPKIIKQLLEMRLKYVNTTISLLKNMVSNNAKILGLTSKELEDIMKISDVKDVNKLKEIFLKNENKFVKNRYCIDMRSVGAGMVITGKEFEIDNENIHTNIGNFLQDLVHYDLIVVAHGDDQEIKRKSDSYDNSKGVESIDKTPIEIYEEIEDVIYKKYDEDQARMFLKCFKKGYNKNRVYIDYEMFPSISKLQKIISDDNINLDSDSVNKMSKDAESIYKKYIEKYKNKYAYSSSNMVSEGNKWTFAYPIQYNGKTYKEVEKLIKDAKANGCKKIKLYSCNPGHYKLSKELEDGVVYSKTCVYIESGRIINKSDYEDNTDLFELYLLENSLIKYAEENNIDYYNNTYLEAATYDMLNGIEYLNEGITGNILDKLLSFIAKIIATIINLVKKLIECIKNFFNIIADKIKIRKHGKISKKIKFKYAILEDAKVVDAEADSQEDIKKAVTKSCKTISKELRARSDLQLKIINDIKKQVEQLKFKYKVNESCINESYIINKKDIYYNKEKFDSGEINLCFITGHSGSGKSTMGRNLQSKNIEHYDLDDLQCIKDYFTMKDLKEYGDLIYSYFNGKGKKFYITYEELVNNKIPGSEYEDILFKDFVHYAMQYAKSHKNKKFVIEGVWLFCYGDDHKYWFTPEEFKDYAFYIKGTSMVISKHRAALRDAKSDNNNKIDVAKAYLNNFIRKNWKWYFIDENRINKFRNYFSKLINESNYYLPAINSCLKVPSNIKNYHGILVINNNQTVNESTKSSIDANYKPNGKKNLSSFKKVHITESIISKYKKEYPFLSHVRCKDTKDYICDGYIWFDNNELVAMVGSCQYTDDKTKWVVSLEITNKYKGYGLSKQILDYATKTMNCKYLSVNKNNAVAKKIYDEYGFKVYQEDKTMYYMTIDKNIKESLYSSSSDSESSIIESKSLEFKELLKTINTPKELSNWMKTNIHYKEYDRLMTANEVFDKKKGSCHDQVNFEVEFFKKFNLKYGKEFLIEYNEGETSGGRTHSFIWFTTKGKYYWFENAWNDEQGIHGPYDSIIDIKKEVKEKMLKGSRFNNIEFSSVKNIKPGMTLDEFVTACLESTIMESMKNNNKLYFLSTINMNDDKLTPRIPSNYFTKNNYEENKTPRVCFAKTIDGCLMGLSKNLTDKEFYVHVPDPDGYYNVYNPTIKEVPDCKITGEVWIKKPVDLKCIGKIKVLKDTGEVGIPFKYGDKTAELYKWDWKWVDKYDDESINESFIDPKVVEIANYINENFIFNEDYFNVKMEPINNNTYLIAEYIIGKNSLDMKKLSDSFSMLKERCNTDQYGLCMIKDSNNNKYNLYLTDISAFKESVLKGPKKCPKCGGKVGVFIEGEPIYKCIECGKFLGVVPCHLGKNKK